MVWFQCEDCGENLKKPKLQNHFRICSANKLSCIDCGFIFNRESVQAHTQCVSEAEKYGPKGEVKGIKNLGAKDKPNASRNADVDLSVGLSTRPPWACSLCNVKTTSRETLSLHSEGKKHRSKARAFQASSISNPNIEPSSNGNISLGNQGSILHLKEQPNAVHGQSEEKHTVVKHEEDELLGSTDDKQDTSPDSRKGPNIDEEKCSKKRKRTGDKSKSFDSMNVENKQDETGQQELHSCGSDQTTHLSAAKEGKGYKFKKMDKSDPMGKSTNEFDHMRKIGENGNGLVMEGLLLMNDVKQNKEKPKKRTKQTDELSNNEYCEIQTRDQCDAVKDTHGSDKRSSKLPVKWKKIIKSVLKESPEGNLRMKKLQKTVIPLAMKALETAGVAADESNVKDEIMRKVLSSSRFVVENKTVYLA